jgi:ElaB/YqjD/DUF883 family membrane-anchored ribosome-binding protein
MAHSKMKIQKDDTEQLRREFDNLREDFVSMARELKSYAGHQGRSVEEAASDRVVALKSVGERQLEAAKSYAVDAAKAAEEGVRAHPGYSVAGAAALGFLLGVVTARRR